MTNLVNTIARIDPSEAFIEYVNTVKPYHTKIMDVVVEYVHTDTVSARVGERYSWLIEMTRPSAETIYSCGFGFVWDPFIEPDSPDNILDAIDVLDATSAIADPDVDSYKSHSFLVGPLPTPVPFNIAAVSALSNQVIFCENYPVSNVDLVNNRWLITDPLNVLTALLTAGVTPKQFVISTNTGTGNGKYTIAGTPFYSSGITYVQVVETLPIQSTGTGIFHRVLETADLPAWLAGTEIKFHEISGVLPAPLDTSSAFYFQPTSTVGYFNLSNTRYPVTFDDFVNLTDTGSGTLTVTRNECFQPGMIISISGSQGGDNDGNYVVREVVKEGLNERVYVYQRVEHTTTGSPPTDGEITFEQNGYDDPPFCPPIQMSDLHADVFIHEKIIFEFDE